MLTEFGIHYTLESCVWLNAGRFTGSLSVALPSTRIYASVLCYALVLQENLKPKTLYNNEKSANSNAPQFL